MFKLLISLEIKKNEIMKILTSKRGEFGVSIVINIAIALIIASFIFLPGMKEFSKNLMQDINDWYTKTLKNSLFETNV